MSRLPKFVPLLILMFAATAVLAAQVSARSSGASVTAAAHAATLAEGGNCSGALPTLARSEPHIPDKVLQKRVGLDGARCATLLQKWGTLLDLVRQLNGQFPRDPEVLYVTVHAYSDLSSQAARELAESAPTSIPALEMDAEANEMQGKWERAQKDYEQILKTNPKYPGIHFRLARLLLSKPNPPADFQEQAQKELEQEVEIDPANAGAEFLLGELALQAHDFDGAIKHLSRATDLNPGFGDAFLGLGVALSAEKKYAEAIAPLNAAVRLEPMNPAAHYSLGTAYSRTGRKAEAEHQFAEQAAIENAAQGNSGEGTGRQ